VLRLHQLIILLRTQQTSVHIQLHPQSPTHHSPTTYHLPPQHTTMANTWLETTLRPNTLPKPPPTTLDRKRSHSMISSVQYRPLTTLQPNIPALDTMHDTMHSPKALRPMSGGRCSLPPIRDLLEVADLGTAGVGEFDAFGSLLLYLCASRQQEKYDWSKPTSNTPSSTITSPTTRHHPI